MKNSDLIGLIIVLVLLFFLIGGNAWEFVIKILLGILLISIVLHWKIAPFKIQLFGKYLKIFNVIDHGIQRIFTNLNFIPRIQLGQHLQLDSTYITLIVCITIIIILL